jgi:hypothetical protein
MIATPRSLPADHPLELPYQVTKWLLPPSLPQSLSTEGEGRLNLLRSKAGNLAYILLCLGALSWWELVLNNGTMIP